MSELFLYDDKTARAFEPFALTRPTCELRAGALLLRERWERALGLRASAVVSSAHLIDFDEPWGTVVARGAIPAGSVLANSRCAVSLSSVAAGDSWRCQNRVSAVVLSRDLEVAELKDGSVSLESLARQGGRSVEITGQWIERIWDFTAQLGPMLLEDIPTLGVGVARTGKALGVLGGGGKHEVFAEDGAMVEPQVYVDTTAGPILIRRGATVQAFTRLVGPCVVGQDSVAGGDKISGSSIGDVCRVHGELAATILLGHSNKAHDGYVGHSYLGRWVNLGASTVTSNLKNTYTSVELWTPEGEQDTGQQFLGTFFGDHTKTGIGTLLNTGTVIGAGAQIYGGAMTPKVIPPFAWGDHPPYSTYRFEKFIDAARRMMGRRHVELTDRQIRLLTAAYERRWGMDATR